MDRRLAGMSLEQRFAGAMGALLGPDFPSDIGLAVSGGGDSMAMLTLAHNWSHVWGVRLWVCTVDHGFRPEAAAEAAMVAEDCAALGHPHAVLRWHWDGTGNKMDAARRGRLALIDAWRGTLRQVLMAHTRDDVAETFLMRLARGSGVEGLSAMQAARPVTLSGGTADPEDYDGTLPPRHETIMGGPGRSGSFRIVRPCLDMTRAELRHYLTVLKGRWVEDPSNDDPAYDRVKMRKAQQTLDALGLDAATLAATAGRMARAGEALRTRALQVWRNIGQEGRVDLASARVTGRTAPSAAGRPIAAAVPADGSPVAAPVPADGGATAAPGASTGEILFDRAGFEAVERDTQLRLLAAALQYVATAEYRPRADALEGLLDRLLGGGGGTLHGCEAVTERDRLRVFREYKAVADARLSFGPGDGRVRLWDGRWHLSAQAFNGRPGLEIRALGVDGWAQVSEKPENAPPFRSARSLPALWQGDTLLACDAMGVGPRPTTRLWPMGREMHSFAQFLMTH